MSRVVDFDAILAETELGEPIELTSGDQTFHVHPEMPWAFAVAWADGRVDDAIALVVPEAERDALRGVVFADNPSKGTALARFAAIWNVDPGEPKASSRSSGNGSKRSRPTSKATTT